MTPSPKLAKKTIYVDVDDEITAVIDKVRTANEQIIALVVPKRASIFLSAVNMKLLKRATGQEKKKLVLITSNPSVLPLAGLVGMHVASNLNSKPYIPSAPGETLAETPAEESIEVDPAMTVGQAMGDKPEGSDDKPIEVDVPSKAETEASQKAAAAGAGAGLLSKLKGGGHKQKLKVPNFNRFRAGLIIAGVLAVVLIVGGYWALAIAPKAIVTITGETKTKQLAFDIKADTAATELNLEDNVVPAKIKEIKKTETEKVAATGQKDKGNKASGKMTLKNCSKSDGSINIPAGTGISSGDLTFITQAAVALEPSSFTGGGTCKSDTKDVAVMAQQAGDKYNVGERSYTVAGYSGVTAAGSEMTGGTTQLVKVVAQSDIESAKSKLEAKQVGATEEVKASLNVEGYIPLADTFASNTGAFVPTPAVDSEASEVIVTVQVSYVMTGVKKDDLQKLIVEKEVKEAGVDTSKESILDDGLAAATYQLGAVKGSITNVSIKNNVVAGPEINQEAIKAEIAGKKRGEAERLISSRPGIKEVRIETSPFFNYSVPKKIQKITLNVEGTDGTAVKP